MTVILGVMLASPLEAPVSRPDTALAPPATFGSQAVRINHPETDDGGLPLGPATVCLMSPERKRCYEPPKLDPPFGRDPQTQTIRLAAGYEALLFTVISTGGGSGYRQLLALVRPGLGTLESLLNPEVVVSEQSEYGFWDEPSIS